MRRPALLAVLTVLVLGWQTVSAYVINAWWPDNDNIVIDNILLPFDPWGFAANDQLLEWNFVDRADGSHPFVTRINPEFSFGANDDENTLGFLGEAALNATYMLSYSNALAWTASWSIGTEIVEADIMVDPTLPWSLGPNDSNWFQSTVLHEVGHVRGLDHHQTWQSIMNDGTSKFLRAETLYMDDMAGVRQNASTVPEVDIVAYPKSHNGSSAPQWMVMSATTAREGQSVTFSNWSLENRGPLPAGDVPWTIYLADSPAITPPLVPIASGVFPGVAGETFRLGSVTATIPPQPDCSVKYVGLDAPSRPEWNERFEQNNTVAMTNGSIAPALLAVLLAQDTFEPNDAQITSRIIPRDFASTALSLDSDTDQDWYYFQLPETMTVVLDVTFDNARGDIDVALYNFGGGMIALSDSVSNQEHIQLRLSAGFYEIRVYGFGVNTCNRYSMTLNAYECLESTDCPGGSDSICGSIYCNSITNTCAQIIPPCSDGDSCTIDFCYPAHGGYCVNLRDPSLDPDVDGVCGEADLCPMVPDPQNLDSDGDGIGDACDADPGP